MGTKHPDQISAGQRRAAVETVGQMYEKCWALTARCRACDLVMLVDLRVVIRMRGPGFSLWNRHTRCRRVVYAGRCRGFVDFEFKAPGMTQPRPLAAADRAPDPRMNHIERAFHDEQLRQLREPHPQRPAASGVEPPCGTRTSDTPT